MPLPTRVILGQPSWRLAAKGAEVFVTRTGGHVGPITYTLGRRKIQPLSVAPWVTEKTDRNLPPIIKVLRGDFFCMPFGGNTTPFRGERHPIHGETANSPWTARDLTHQDNRHTLHLSLDTKIRQGRVDKFIALVDGHNAVYSRHVISGMSGPMNPGHHAMVKFPDHPGSGVISTSPFIWGQVFYEPIERPEALGYSILKPGTPISSLSHVPTVTGQIADLSRYPARRGYDDLIMISAKPDLPYAWTAVTFAKEGYVWFALKDPRTLASTVFWISNGGRHMSPWSSRHINVIGLEEVTSYFHPGLAESVKPNPLSQLGIPTYLDLTPRRPTVINYIMAAAAIPRGFDKLIAIDPGPGEGKITLRAQSGKTVSTALDLAFLHGTA